MCDDEFDDFDLPTPQLKTEAVYHMLNCNNTKELEHIFNMLNEFKFQVSHYTYWEENNCQKSLDWLTKLINDMRKLEQRRTEENKKNGF